MRMKLRHEMQRPLRTARDSDGSHPGGGVTGFDNVSNSEQSGRQNRDSFVRCGVRRFTRGPGGRQIGGLDDAVRIGLPSAA
jgi:hypothetical protein